MVDLKDKMLRQHLTKATKVALHPIRRKILSLLKNDSSLSTTDFIEKLSLKKEERYNLYHHLSILENFNLIKKDSDKESGKLQFYKKTIVKNPIMIAYSFDEDDMKKDEKSINKILDEISNIEDYPIKKRDKIKMIEINISYK